jgi:hypothetical protein
MTPRSAALAAVALLLPAAASFASPATDSLDDLSAAVAGREGSTPSESKALAKAAAQLDRASDSLAGALKIAAAAAKALEKGFPGDGEFGALLDAAVDSFRSEVAAERDTVAGLADLLGDSKQGTAAAKALEKADAALAAADAAESAADAFKSLAKALKSADKGLRAAGLKGDSWMYAVVDGEYWSGSLLVQGIWDGLALTAYGVSGKGLLSPTTSITVSKTLSGTGTYPLGDYEYEGKYQECPALGGACDSFQTFGGGFGSGTLTVTEFGDYAEGTFSFTAWNSDQGRLVTVTGGRFRIRLPAL